MKRVLLLAALVLLAGCGQQVTAASSSPRYVFIGDSLTAGYFASTQAHDFASLVTAHEHAVAVDTHGRYGWTTVATLKALQAQPAPPGDVVVVELGTNDVGARGETIQQFAAAYKQVIASLQHTSPHAQFVCLGVWRDPQQDGATPPGWRYDQVIQQNCPGAFVWLGGLYMNFNLHGPQGRATWKGAGDWFHPDDKGHIAIARAIELVITSTR